MRQVATFATDCDNCNTLHRLATIATFCDNVKREPVNLFGNGSGFHWDCTGAASVTPEEIPNVVRLWYASDPAQTRRKWDGYFNYRGVST